MPDAIVVSHATKIIRGRTVLDDVTLSLPRGGIYGCSGILETTGFWDESTGMKNLLMLASIKEVVGKREVRKALERVGLDPDDKRPFSTYSMGMRQRLTIAQAIMEAPELLILDEPTNALDVEGIETVSRIVREEHERGCTVLVSCHNEPALEALFEREWRMVDGHVAGEVNRR